MREELQVFDNVLSSQELETMIDDLNNLADVIPSPHTGELLPKKYDDPSRPSLNVLKPRVNCYNINSQVNSSYGLVDLREEAKEKNPHTAESKERRDVEAILRERQEDRIHGKAHHGQWLPKKHLPESIKKILNLANVEYGGTEWWCYDSAKYPIEDKGTGVGRHIDYDGGLAILTGKVQPCLASVVFYNEVDENLNGGALRSFKDNSGYILGPISEPGVIDNEVVSVVEPIPNRAVVIPHNVLHDVTAFTGRRTAFVFLLWHNRPIEFI